MPEIYYSLAEVENRLGIKYKMLAYKIKKGLISAHKIKNVLHISDRSFHKLLEEQERDEALKNRKQPLCQQCGKVAGFTKGNIPKTYCSKKCSDEAFRKTGRKFGQVNNKIKE